MRPLGEALHRQGFTVEAIHLPGHGGRMEDMEKTGWQEWLQAAKEAFLSLKEHCGQVSVAGLSMGGVLALVLAQQMSVAAVAPLSGAVAPDSHLFTFRESMALLYYPLWLVRFQAGDRACRVVVNGRDGTVNSGVAPASNRRRVALLAAQAVLAAAACAVLVWLAATRDSGRATMVALAVIVFVAAALAIWRFRMVGEVEYHEPFSG